METTWTHFYQFAPVQIHLKLLLDWYCQPSTEISSGKDSQVSILEAAGTLSWGTGFAVCGTQEFCSSLQQCKVTSNAQCWMPPLFHPIRSNRGCSGALCTAKDQVCHLFWCFQRGKKITIESLWKPLVFNDLSAPFYCVLLEKTFNLF